MSTIAELMALWRDVRARRLALVAKAKEIENGIEAQLQDALALAMQQAGLQNTTVKGVGQAYFTTDIKASVADPERTCAWMLDHMKAAEAAGLPLMDVLILQKVPLKRGVLDYITGLLGADASDAAIDAAAKDMGISFVRMPKLAFNSQKDNKEKS